MLFSYGAEGVDDDDWGCVYRSYQNALAHSGYLPIRFLNLVKYVNRGWGQWAEPADFAALGNSMTLLAGHSRDWLKHTSKAQYQLQLPSVALLESYVAEFGHASAFVVDDGISGYAIVPYKGRICWVDPHTHTPRRVPWKKQLRRSTGWMVLQLFSLEE